MSYIVVQIIGIVAMCLTILSYQLKTQKQIVSIQVFSAVLWVVHFFTLGALSGAVLNLLSMVRNAVYSQKDKKWAASIIWPVFFIIAILVLYVCNFAFFGVKATEYNMAVEVLPTVGTIMFTLALRMPTAGKVRIFTLMSSPFWLAYNAISGSVGGVCAETFAIVSVIVGIIRLDIKRKR